MADTELSLLAFNRGRISRLGQARLDLKEHTFLSAAKQTNYVSRVLGSMMLRPGRRYIGSTLDDNLAYHIPFVFSANDKAIIELTAYKMRVRIDDTIITRPAVSSAVANGAFTSNLNNWTDADEAGATSAHHASGYMSLLGTGYKKAIRTQEVTVGVLDQNVEHALDIVIERGPVVIKVGSSAGADDYIAETTLLTGHHSLAFTPTGNFHIRLENIKNYASLVDSIDVAAAGEMEIDTPWEENVLGRDNTLTPVDGNYGAALVRHDQSADVVYVACAEHPTLDLFGDSNAPRRIERRGDGRSWSVVKHEPEDGPFRTQNIGPTTITPSAKTGDITLTASYNLFSSGHIGALFRMTSTGQQVSVAANGADQFTSSIRVTGVGTSRNITLEITGTWVATVTLQRSIDDGTTWTDVTTYTGNTAITYNDALDNQIALYRIGIKTGNYTSGTANLFLTYASGGITGIVRITSYSSATSVGARVLQPLGGTGATSDWEEGRWSDYRGWPSAVRLFQGRLWWAGKQYVWGSVSDAYDSHDDTIEGNSAPIQRSIGSGPLDDVNWLMPLTRLFLGTASAEWQAKSSSLDEPLTTTQFSLVSQGTQGSAAVDAVKMDSSGFFLQFGAVRVYAISYKYTGLTDDYGAEDVTRWVPEMGRPGITRMAIQRQPDTRLHCVRRDGTVAMLVLEKNEEMLCWVDVVCQGAVEDVFTMPGEFETEVYYTVRYTIDGETKRYLEQWAMESECSGGSFLYEGASATVIPLVDSANDRIYQDGTIVTARDIAGAKIGNYTVSDASITLGAAVIYAHITPTLYKLADSFVEYSGAAASTLSGLDHLEGEEVVVWADGKDFSPGRGDDQTTYTVTAGAITLGSQVQRAIIGLPYTARYQSNKLGYVGDNLSLTHEKYLTSLGLVLADTHKFGIHYGTDFGGNMDDLPLIGPLGAATPDDQVWPALDDKQFSLDGSWSTDARLCLESNAPRPCTVLAAVVPLEVS